MMTMLLQFFCDHQCLSLDEIIDWYANDTFASDKKWVEPFLQQHHVQMASSGEFFFATKIFISLSSSDSPVEETANNTTSVTSPTSSTKRIRIRKPFRNLVKLFRNPSQRNDQAIHDYIKV